MKLYVDREGTAPSPRRVRIYLAEKGIEVPLERLETPKLNRAPEFRARNPVGSLPMLELDDGTCIAESLAICRYFEVARWAGLAVGLFDQVTRERPFLAGQRLSIADVFLYGALDYGIQQRGWALPAELASLQAWYAAMHARPSARA